MRTNSQTCPRSNLITPFGDDWRRPISLLVARRRSCDCCCCRDDGADVDAELMLRVVDGAEAVGAVIVAVIPLNLTGAEDVEGDSVRNSVHRKFSIC